MSRLQDISAKTLSVIFYPLFVPTYGIALFCIAHSIHIAPLNGVWVWVAVLGTLILTCVLPVTAIWIMMKRGQVRDLNLDDPAERTMPYIYSVFGFACWCYLLITILHVPLFMAYIAIGATAAIAMVALINRFWKISAHLTGFGGLLGGLFTYCVGIGAIPTWGTIALWAAVSLILMWARLHLKAHTPAQVSAGWLLGLACTCVPYCIYSYVV